MKTDKYIIKSFFNSFARDFNGEIIGRSLKIALQNGDSLIVSLEKKSLLGNHTYSGEIVHVDSKNIILPISFKEAVGMICDHFFSLDRGSDFENFVFNSYDYSKEIEENEYLYQSNDEYLKSEQCLIYGHPVHPFPKARIGFSQADNKHYAPEYGGEFNLIWVSVHHSICKLTSKSENHIEFKVLSDFDCENKVGEGFSSIPFHPWQFENLKETKLIKNYIDAGKMIIIGHGRNKWASTSSVRSLYNKDAPYFPKFSMSLKITNSVRHLTENEAKRGLEVSKILKLEKVKKIGNFKILQEPSYFSLLDLEGKSIKESICVLRENELSPEAKPVLLSYLTEKTRLFEQIRKIAIQEEKGLRLIQKMWFESFLNNVVSPILGLASSCGILLGAHMQNLILEMKSGFVDGCIFKDCQGTGYSSLGFKNFSEIGNLNVSNGNVIDEENVNKIFIYYIFVNTTMSVISALSNNEEEDEIYLLNLFRNHLLVMNQSNQNIDKSIFSFLLRSEYLYQKSNFKCSVMALNENTMVDPSQIYNKISNPLTNVEFNLREIQNKKTGLLKSKKVSFLKNELSLRSVNPQRDIDFFWNWQNKEYVSQFWEMNYSKEELLNYLIDTAGSPYKEPVIFEVAGEPVGYFELYWAFDDRIAPYCDARKYDRGIHLLFGEEKYLGTRYVPEGLVLAKEYMFESCDKTQTIWGEPRNDNKNIMKLVRFLPGWEFVREFDFSHKRAALIKCTREDFYKDLMGWKK